MCRQSRTHSPSKPYPPKPYPETQDLRLRATRQRLPQRPARLNSSA